MMPLMMPPREVPPLPAPFTDQSPQLPGAVIIQRSTASIACQRLIQCCSARFSALTVSTASLRPPIIALIVIGATITALAFIFHIRPLAVGASVVVGATLAMGLNCWQCSLPFAVAVWEAVLVNTLWPLSRREWLTHRLDGVTVSDATVLLRQRKCADVYLMLKSQAVRILRSPPESGKTSLVTLLLLNKPFWRLSFRVDLSGWQAQTTSLEDYWQKCTGASLESSLDPYSGRSRTYLIDEAQKTFALGPGHVFWEAIKHINVVAVQSDSRTRWPAHGRVLRTFPRWNTGRALCAELACENRRRLVIVISEPRRR